MPTLACYLRREDGEWFELGERHQWRTSFATFPGWPDGSTILTPEDAHVLALRLDGYGHSMETRERMAADIIRWMKGQRTWFMSELNAEVEPGVVPSPITGSVRETT